MNKRADYNLKQARIQQVLSSGESVHRSSCYFHCRVQLRANHSLCVSPRSYQLERLARVREIALSELHSRGRGKPTIVF